MAPTWEAKGDEGKSDDKDAESTAEEYSTKVPSECTGTLALARQIRNMVIRNVDVQNLRHVRENKRCNHIEGKLT